ncbi:hypothetical protein Vi05172_g980 [Venturia inaequalis]|uniref:Uncharacterized protein n=1 Tax=Venturia inaequalis TaxID=5025 RepID=A0A8H3V258_VENIN|nr:hypothetical protein EG327_006891 [Venturia inaequalis]RDI89075.1 hypothetical protein Vi05172_g980 [Venturia inaequalis]
MDKQTASAPPTAAPPQPPQTATTKTKAPKKPTNFLSLPRELRQRILIEGLTPHFCFPTWEEAYHVHYSWAKDLWTLEKSRDYMWVAYRSYRDEMEYDMKCFYTGFCKFSPALKADMDYVRNKWMEVWVARKRAMKKKVREWVGWLIGDETEIEGGLGPVSYGQEGDVENDDSEFEPEDEEDESEEEDDSKEKEDGMKEKSSAKLDVGPGVGPDSEVSSVQDTTRTMSEEGEGAKREEPLSSSKEMNGPLKRTKSEMGDVIKLTESEQPEKKRKMY